MIGDWEWMQQRWARLDEQRATPPSRPVYPVDPLEMAVPDTPAIPKWSPELASRPVVALDLDGVLNVWTRDNQPPPGTTVMETVIPAWACARATYLRGHGHGNSATTVTVDPEHGPWIRSLLDRGVDVVWSTTWETAANVVYAPLLGIPPLPVVLLNADPPHHKGGSPEVKSLELARMFVGRPVVWLDDHSQYLEGAGNMDLRGRPGFWPTLTPRVYGDTGLTKAVRDEVDNWLDAGPDAGAGRLDGCCFDELLEVANGGDWRTPLRARIRSRAGVLGLLGRDGQWMGRPSAKLRANTGLPASVWVHGFPESTDQWVVAGEDVRVSLSPARGAGRGQVRVVDLGTLFGIDVFNAAPRNKPAAWESGAVNLAGQKRTQEIAEAAAACFDGAGDAAVKTGWGASVWDGDTALEITTTAGFVTVTAHTLDDGYLDDGRPTYGRRRVHADVAPVWLYQRGNRGLGSDLDPERSIEYAITMWRRWQLRDSCEHPAAGAFCPDCGARCDGAPW